MTTLKQAKNTEVRVKKHAEIMEKLIREEAMEPTHASKIAYQLLVARTRRKITQKLKNR